MATEEIELNFRLDGDGRTAPPQGDCNGFLKAKPLRYEPQTVQAAFIMPNSGDTGSNGALQDDNIMDELLMDCEIADSGLMPRTFWMSSDAKPRFSLEQMALDVFEHHVRRLTAAGDESGNSFLYDPKKSGAEWWVQLRPSPENAGRYSMHVHNKKEEDGTENDSQDLSKTGISFHWDKDEDLRILCGGNTYLHAHVSTVTYLTNFGAPTLAVNCRVHPLTGDWILPSTAENSETDDSKSSQEELEAFVCWPLAGKHLSFDGRFLHAAPTDLMEEGAFERQCEFTPVDEDKVKNRKLQRRHRRVTFLVNVWINYKPFNVNPFPETMVDKMSGYDKEDGKKEMSCIAFPTSDDKATTMLTREVGVKGGKVTNQNAKDAGQLAKQFTWPMGGCDSGETIRMQIPLGEVRAEAKKGGNVKIQYSKAIAAEQGVILMKSGEEKASENQPKRQKTDASA